MTRCLLQSQQELWKGTTWTLKQNIVLSPFKFTGPGHEFQDSEMELMNALDVRTGVTPTCLETRQNGCRKLGLEFHQN